MLNRFLELEQYIYLAISKCNNPPDMLKCDEIQILKDLISLMKPIESIITEISGQSYPTCSVIIPLVHCMKSTIHYNKPSTEIGIAFKEKLQSAIENRCKNFENNEIMSIAIILDPRFKKLHFDRALAAATAISRIESLLNKNTPKKIIELNVNLTYENCDVWNIHDHMVAKNNNNSNENLTELKQYLRQTVIERKKDPFQYWKSVKHTFPLLYELAIKYISILGTSVPLERIFSQAGNIKTDERNRLTGEHLNMLLFLSSLAFEDWKLE
ncbi:Zinc finger BED domain-containing protein 1 [Trachymyrmex cornetzi]|uniref:Zinc finger BED domain-containing protein 1 n=1 Tax=Trachymyrmex cornetzi TaxID=471704 RepID=A0A151J7Z4_9HYME|nr:Zinc finger BED domain-containing protein 1 [Trachymyrmex cornetzi]